MFRSGHHSICKRSLTMEQQRLIQSIQAETELLNSNNVTRTMAYLHFYQNHPEIHWAFLAHMVSRNAGWNMTDLKGEFLPKLLSDEECTHYFMWLERGNWLIFQDAYPQLLLYEASKKHKTSLFFLLPYLHVSAFMIPIWMDFWQKENVSALALALIINEQNYIETRIIQNPYYEKNVMSKSSFLFQDMLNLNFILFPSDNVPGKPELVGKIVRDFTSLKERISIGKRLYSTLFDQPECLEAVSDWALTQVHTGSRKDYWPNLFNDVRESLPGRLYNPQIKECELKDGVPKLYSPQLRYAWKDVEHKPAGEYDWFQEDLPIDQSPDSVEAVENITQPYCKSLEKLSFFVFTKKAIFQRKS